MFAPRFSRRGDTVENIMSNAPIPVSEEDEESGASFAWIPLLASGLLVATMGFYSIHNGAYAVAAGVAPQMVAVSVAVPLANP